MSPLTGLLDNQQMITRYGDSAIPFQVDSSEYSSVKTIRLDNLIIEASSACTLHLSLVASGTGLVILLLR
jgi:hypothetical protein